MGITFIERVARIKAAEHKNSVWIETWYVFRAEGTVWRARTIGVVKIRCEQNKIFRRGFLVLLLIKFRTYKDRRSI